jgi:hypothetical protein
MRRLHAVAADAEQAKVLFDDLKSAGIDRSSIHLFAKDHACLKAAGLPEPTEMEEKILTGEGVGLLIDNLMGIGPPDPRIKEFDNDISEGRVLMVIVVPKKRAGEIGELISRHEQIRFAESA